MAEQEIGSEARSLKRRHLIYYLEVYNDETGDLIGHLVDLNLSGMKLITKQEIIPDKNFRLGMLLPEDLFGESVLKFDARSMWSRKDVNPDFYAVGMKVYNLDKETGKIISELINKVGFND